MGSEVKAGWSTDEEKKGRGGEGAEEIGSGRLGPGPSTVKRWRGGKGGDCWKVGLKPGEGRQEGGLFVLD